MVSVPTRFWLRELIAHIVSDQWKVAFEPIITRGPAHFGEFTSNIPLQLAPYLRQTPHLIGQTLIMRLAAHFPGHIEFQHGRLNFFMSDDLFRSTLEQAARDGAHYGAGDSLAGQRILVEYVSSDPTGPLPFVAGRHAAVGEALCRLFELQGARVTREFYLNDATSSTKIQLLGESVANWYLEAFGRGAGKLQDGMSDGFVRGIAAEWARRDGAQWLDATPNERNAAASKAALDAAIASQRSTLEHFGVRFDEWVSEHSLRHDGRVERMLALLQENGHTYESDSALWLRSTKFGDDADRVLRRQNGQLTYFASDIAYHIWKGERGFDRIINLWSAEHDPYIVRTKAALQAAGVDLNRFEFLVCEGAVLKRDGAPLRLGSSGGPLLLEEELAEVGADALKFQFLRTDIERNAQVELESRDNETNPAYAAQLLPSRLARLERETQGLMGAASSSGAENVENLEWSPGEREIARLVALWPDEAAEATRLRQPSRVTKFVGELASATRELLEKSSPLTAPLPQRQQLLRAAQNAAGSALKVLGIESRDKF